MDEDNDSKHSIKATVGAHTKNSKLIIGGYEVPYCRGFTIVSDFDQYGGKSTVKIKVLAVRPFELDGEGNIIVEAKVVNREVARQVYESLKKIFENDGNENEHMQRNT